MQSLDERSAPLLFEIANARYLHTDTALHRLRRTPGILPIAITSANRIVWLDVDRHAFKEWKFRFSIRQLAVARPPGDCFTTDIALLAEPELDVPNSLQPAGFVFHMSKCGSTLMARVLDVPDNHLVMQEPTPLHERFWAHLTEGWSASVEPNSRNLRMVRNLIRLLGRARLPAHDTYFVRFRSWNIAFVTSIHGAFPDTPCLFMYRDPVSVLASIAMKPTTGLTRLLEYGAAAFITERRPAELRAMQRLDYYTCFYKRYLQTALQQMPQNTLYLNYRDLNTDNLDAILQLAFDYRAPTPQRAALQAQFETYSKDDTGMRRFSSDTQSKQDAVTPAMREAARLHLQDAYVQLDAHPKNFRQVRARLAPTSGAHRHDRG